MAKESDYSVSDKELQDFCEVRVVKKISNRDIFDMLITAFEGGINYWCGKIDAGKLGHVSASKAFAMGQLDSIMLLDNEEEKWVRLSQENVRKGLRIMAKKYTRHFNDMINDNADAITADVFIQCAVFGETIYG